MPSRIGNASHGLQILIVEDDFLVAEKLRGMLEDEGYCVIGDTDSGEQAIQLTTELRPDVVIMDVNLPGMDGITAARQITATSPTPIVALTAYENTDLVTEAVEAGIGYYLVKPTSRGALTRAIQIAVARFDDLAQLRDLNATLEKEIQEHQRVEAALRRSEALLNESQAIAHVGSWELDLATDQLTWSDEVYRIFGLPPQILAPTYAAFLDFIHPDDREAVDAAYARSVQEGQDGYAIEHRIRRRDNGDVRIVVEKCRHVRDPSGQIIRSVGMVQDITERRRDHAQIERYTEALKRSNAELEQFAYVISHDLREPARTVKNFLMLLTERYGESLDERAASFVALAMDGAVRMQEMINAVLDLARVETQGRPLTATETGAMLEQALRSLQNAIEESGATVTHDPMPRVMADEAQAAQLFQNLIANAIKFRRAGIAPQVHVAAAREGDWWVFTVADNGIGIDPTQADRLFQIFQRLHTRDEYPGLGLGLALCKRIVTRHGGRIWVEPAPGEGARFCFTLPAPNDPPCSANKILKVSDSL